MIPHAVPFVREDGQLHTVTQRGLEGFEHAVLTGGETTVFAAADDVKFGEILEQFGGQIGADINRRDGDNRRVGLR